MAAMPMPAPMPALAPVLRPELPPVAGGAVEVEVADKLVSETRLAEGLLAGVSPGEELCGRAILVVVVDVTVTPARRTLVYVLNDVVVVSDVYVVRYVDVE